MIRTNHNCKTSRYYKKMYEQQCKITDQLQTKLEEQTMSTHKVNLDSLNEVALQIDEMINAREAAQMKRLEEFDRLEREIGKGVEELSKLQTLARKHASLLPF